jgi:hypothetical protein
MRAKPRGTEPLAPRFEPLARGTEPLGLVGKPPWCGENGGEPHTLLRLPYTEVQVGPGNEAVQAVQAVQER